MEPQSISQTTIQTPAPLIAFHGDPRIKAKYLRRIRAHRKADELVRGRGWDNGKGCAIGCTLNAYDHQAYETELGIPELIAHLEDSIFEGLPVAEAMEWPDKFLAAIPVGADLSNVIPQIVVWQFEDVKWGLQNTEEVKDSPKLRELCVDLVALYRRKLDGGIVMDCEWESIYDRAWAGTWAGAGAWAWARARARAWAGAGAWARARARAWAGAEPKAYNALAEKLLQLVTDAPVQLAKARK
jgi:hypothetical protein